MKKIVFLILFLTGLSPVFKNNSINLNCGFVYAQEPKEGEETVYICKGTKVKTQQQGDWLIEYTCTLENEGGVATNDCVSVCEETGCTWSPIDPNNSDPNDSGGGSGGGDSGGGSGGSGGSGGGGQQDTPKYGVPPITKEEFEKFKSIDWKNHNYNIQVKQNYTHTIKETGIKILGELTKIESNTGEKFYKFTPYNTTSIMQKGLYYHIDAKYIQNSITYYTFESDSTGFPISGWAYLGGLFDSWGNPLKIEFEPNDSPIVIINDVPLTMRNWCLDGDRDKYHSRIMQASSRPGQAWAEGTSKGLDCNDNDPRATTDCRPEWILDKDGDGYHTSTARSDTSPGQYWVKGRPIEYDCNDNAYSATNNCTSRKWYIDADKDGWANILDAVEQPGPGWTNWPMQGPDCDDTKPSGTNDCSSATLLIGPEYNNSFPVNFGIVSLDIKSKTENNNLVIAAIDKHINDMLLSDLTKIVNYYNININVYPAGKVDAYAVKKEVSDFISLNKALSPSTQSFQDWLASVISIQMSSERDNLNFIDFPVYNSVFAEDDDYAKVGQSDPFFVNKTDDPWRLKQYLSPDDTYVIGFVAGVGDGVIETVDLGYTLVKYGVKNTPSVLLYRLVTDTENTIQEKLDEIQVVKGIVAVVFDKTKQEQIFNSIKAATVNWFEDITFQKTKVQAGYQHGKIVFEILGALIGIEEVKLLLETGSFSVNALRVVNKVQRVFNSGRKFKVLYGETHLIDEIGNPISKGDDIARVLDNLANPMIDAQKAVVDQYKTVVDNFAETIGDFTNIRKGNYGEMATDLKLSEKGYIPLHTRIDDIDAAGHNGIDNVFEKDGQYFIVESKYSKTGNPTLNPANPSTGLPKQMSDDWILNDNRLSNAVGDDLAREIEINGYTKIVATHSSNGTVTYRLVDDAGNIGDVWIP